MAFAFNGTTPNLNYAVNRLNKKQSLLGKISNALSQGAGSNSGNADIESAVTWAITIANDDTHGYDQANRQGPDYDCSSLVSNAWAQAGAGVNPNDSTREMKEDFTAHGFKWYAGNPSNDLSILRRGDVLLNIQNHTAMYIGGGQIVEACINEFGGITGGQPGDQTGQEIRVGGYWDDNWDGFLRYEK